MTTGTRTYIAARYDRREEMRDRVLPALAAVGLDAGGTAWLWGTHGQPTWWLEDMHRVVA